MINLQRFCDPDWHTLDGGAGVFVPMCDRPPGCIVVHAYPQKEVAA